MRSSLPVTLVNRIPSCLAYDRTDLLPGDVVRCVEGTDRLVYVRTGFFPFRSMSPWLSLDPVVGTTVDTNEDRIVYA